jgi:hypothetical protein
VYRSAPVVIRYPVEKFLQLGPGQNKHLPWKASAGASSQTPALPKPPKSLPCPQRSTLSAGAHGRLAIGCHMLQGDNVAGVI